MLVQPEKGTQSGQNSSSSVPTGDNLKLTPNQNGKTQLMTTKGPGLTLSRWFNHETSRIAMKHPAPVNNWQASRVILRSLRPPRWSGVRNFLGKLGRLSPRKRKSPKYGNEQSMQREFATRFFGISFVPSLPIPAVFNYVWRGEFITRWKQDAVAVVRTTSSNDVMPKWPPLDFSVIDSHLPLMTILVFVIGWPRNTILNFLRSSSVKTLKGTHIAHLLPKLPSSSFILITPDETWDNGRVSHYISHPTNAILRSMKC